MYDPHTPLSDSELHHAFEFVLSQNKGIMNDRPKGGWQNETRPKLLADKLLAHFKLAGYTVIRGEGNPPARASELPPVR